MPKLRIYAYYFSEDELAAILPHMDERSRTDCYIFGESDQKGVSELRNNGVLVDILVGEVSASTGLTRSLKPDTAGENSTILDLQADPIDLDHSRYYLLSFARAPLPQWLDLLESNGINILERIEGQIYKAEVDDSTLLDNLDFILSFRPFNTTDKLVVASRSVISRDIFDPVINKPAIYDILVHQPSDIPSFEQFLKSLKVNTIEVTSRKIRVMLDTPEALQVIGQRSEVNSIEEFVPPVLHNDLARIQLNIDSRSSTESNAVTNLTGKDQLVGVADTGIDTAHPDLADRVKITVPLGRAGDPSDPNGHGTHVAGSIVGTGAASQGMIRGIAPEAELFFQSLMDPDGGLGGLPADLQELFLQAYEAGVRIHNNSWGAATASEYRFTSLEVDEFVYNHKDMLIIISAGNEGSALHPRNSQPGYVDWLSLGSPATAKNGLSVGASRSTRTKGGFAGLTHGQAWPGSYPDLPIRDQKISGDRECLAGFSSRGPCGNESRIKPDLVAPGTDIASAKSSLAPSSHFWGPYPKNRQYAFMGGTSMSAPIVSGFAALVREFLVISLNHNPSAALLKAVIINGCRKLTGSDALADHNFIPNFHQGFGCIDLRNTLPGKLQPELQLRFIDSWKQPELQFNSSGQRFLFRFEIEEELPLQLCLTWTDPPGRGLQNNLNLVLLHKPTEFKWTGNHQLPRSITAFDRDNNVEVICIGDPHPGEYWVAVQANNLIFRPQDFALAITGKFKTDLEQIS